VVSSEKTTKKVGRAFTTARSERVSLQREQIADVPIRPARAADEGEGAAGHAVWFEHAHTVAEQGRERL
jgi:hypothetical protein